MTREQFKRGRAQLGLTQEQLGLMLGYDDPESAKSHVCHMEAGRRGINGHHVRLMKAYLSGYRPEDWPK